jgi:HK97 family phage major capsid protein
MKINELIEKRSDIVSQIDTLLAEELNDEKRAQVASLEKEYDKLGGDIETLKKQTERSKTTTAPVETRNENKPIEVRFQSWLQGDHSQPFIIERASPVLSTTDSAIVEKQVVGSVDVLHSPARAALQKLGVKFYQKNGALVLPAMAENTAKFVSEDGDASTADMATSSLTLTPRRISAFQPFTFEFLNETNPQIFADYLQNLIYGYDLAIANDVFDQIDTDAATQKSTFGGATLSNRMIVQMEVSIGGLGTGQMNYVTTPAVKGYLKNTIALGSTAGAAIWSDDEVNGLPAVGLPSANSAEIYLGDFSRAAVLETGALKVIYDEVTRAKQGETIITIVGGADSGVINPRAFCILTNASIG